jgi:hypothetical protein
VIILRAIEAFLIVLVVGDFASTFFYHVPQHVWFKLHLRTHHDRRRSYWDHAVLSRNPAVLLDGLLGALPYIGLVVFCWPLSPAGALAGLAAGQFHVWWRHTVEIGWKTPPWFVRISRFIGLVLPEDHNGHHVDPDIEFGDIFRFYDPPARAFMAMLRVLSRKRRPTLRPRATIRRTALAIMAAIRRSLRPKATLRGIRAMRTIRTQPGAG